MDEPIEDAMTAWHMWTLFGPNDVDGILMDQPTLLKWFEWLYNGNISLCHKLLPVLQQHQRIDAFDMLSLSRNKRTRHLFRIAGAATLANQITECISIDFRGLR
jgi:hypothetical protein